MNKCELILAMIAGMFHAVFKRVFPYVFRGPIPGAFLNIKIEEPAE